MWRSRPLIYNQRSGHFLLLHGCFSASGTGEEEFRRVLGPNFAPRDVDIGARAVQEARIGLVGGGVIVAADVRVGQGVYLGGVALVVADSEGDGPGRGNCPVWGVGGGEWPVGRVGSEGAAEGQIVADSTALHCGAGEEAKSVDEAEGDDVHEVTHFRLVE